MSSELIRLGDGILVEIDSGNTQIEPMSDHTIHQVGNSNSRSPKSPQNKPIKNQHTTPNSLPKIQSESYKNTQTHKYLPEKTESNIIYFAH